MKRNLLARTSLAAALLSISGCALLAGLGDYEVTSNPPINSNDANFADAPNNTSDGAITDAPIGSDDATPNDGGLDPTDADASSPNASCDPNDLTLLVCLSFETGFVDESREPASISAASLTRAPGAVNQGAVFNGATSLLTVNPAPKLANLTAITIELFVRLTALPVVGTRMGVLDTDGRFGIFIHPTHWTGSVGDVFTVPSPFPIQQITHVALTRDEAKLQLIYRDGVQVGSVIGANPIGAAGAAINIGMNQPSGDPFNGTLDEIRIYSRAKSAAEIVAAAARLSP